MALPTPVERPAPRGTRLITSTPHATATSIRPELTRPCPSVSACCADPHWLSTVVLGTLAGSPPVSHDVLVTLNACWPTCPMHPPITWSTRVGSIPDREISSAWTVPRRSAEWNVDIDPLRFPIG